MALQTLTALMRYPFNSSGTGTVSMNGGTIVDASGEYYGFVGSAQTDMVVSHVGFKAAAVAGSPTAEIRIETVNASTGEPSGTLFDTNTNVTTGTLTTSWAVHALTASATISRGSFYALIIKYASGTSFTVDTLGAVGSTTPAMPYVVHYNGTSVTKSVGGNTSPSIALGSSGTAFYLNEILRPVSAAGLNTFSNSVAGAMRGARFQVPFKCRAIGLLNHMGNNAGDFEVGILSDAGSELSNSITAIDGDFRQAGATASNGMLFFDNAVALDPSTWYRAIVRPTSATNINISTITAASADVRSAMPGGTTWHYATFTTAGGWDDSNTTIFPIMSLLIDQLDDGAGGSGGASFSGYAM